jgi:hypothetical protein
MASSGPRADGGARSISPPNEAVPCVALPSAVTRDEDNEDEDEEEEEEEAKHAARNGRKSDSFVCAAAAAVVESELSAWRMKPVAAAAIAKQMRISEHEIRVETY